MPRIAPNNTGYFQIRESIAHRPGDVAITIQFVGHPDTEPSRIREIQTRDVDHAAMMYGTLDVNEISDITMLPVWNVKRALHELGLVLMEEKAKKIGPQPKRLTAKDRLLAVMSNAKWVNVERLVKLTGIVAATVVGTMNENKRLFEKCIRGSTMGKAERYYRIKTQREERGR